MQSLRYVPLNIQVWPDIEEFSIWLDLRSAISGFEADSADEVEGMLRALHEGLLQSGYDDPTLSKYFVEVEVLRSMEASHAAIRSDRMGLFNGHGG